jgi:outer membrane protein TolC
MRSLACVASAFVALTLAQVVLAQSPETTTDVLPPKPPSLDFDAELRARQAEPGGLRAEDVAARAAATSSTVRAKQREVDAEAATQREAYWGWYPRLNLTARYTRYSPYEQPGLGPLVAAPGAGDGPVPPGTPLVVTTAEFPAFVDLYYLQAQLVIPLTDYVFKVSEQQRGADESRAAAELRLRAARAKEASDAKLLYYAWAEARLQEVVAKQTVENARTQQKAAEDLLELGRGVKADVLSAKARVASAERLEAQARLNASRLEADLRTVLHASADEHLAVGEDLTKALPPPNALRLDALYAEAEQKRPELRAYEANARALERQESVVASAGIPRVDLFANGYYANPNMRFLPPQDEWRATWDVGAQLTWTPNDWATSSAKASRVSADRERVLAERDALRDALRREVSEAHRAVLDAEAALASADTRRDAAEEAYRARQDMYSLGKGNLVELMSAETELVMARLEWVDARVAQRVAAAKLSHAVGRDIP